MNLKRYRVNIVTPEQVWTYEVQAASAYLANCSAYTIAAAEGYRPRLEADVRYETEELV